MKMKSILLGLVSMTAFACGGTGPGNNPDGGTPDANGCSDRDSDGLCDDDEATHGTNPDVADSDNDGLNDGKEIELGTNPLNPDTDGDGIPDGAELELETDPLVPDEGCASPISCDPQPEAVRHHHDGRQLRLDGRGDPGREDQINTSFAQILTEAQIDYA